MIELKNISKKYKNSIFSNTTITFPDNCINFIMGNNGCGKTTLFKCISGLENYDGIITFDNQSIADIRNQLYILWDDTPFYQKLSGIDNIYLFCEDKISKRKITDIASEYIDYSTLKRNVRTYSYGQKKKLALVLLNILKPKYILMDEISNGLDIDTMKSLEKNICDLAKDSTIILTGHQFAFYQHIADNVFVKKGENLIQVDYDKNNNIGLEAIYDEKLN